MNIAVDRTRGDVSPALLEWHAAETKRLLTEATKNLSATLGVLGHGLPEGVVDCIFETVVKDFQVAGAQFDRLHALVRSHGGR